VLERDDSGAYGTQANALIAGTVSQLLRPVAGLFVRLFTECRTRPVAISGNYLICLIYSFIARCFDIRL
jgi:hypothetical protein